MTDDLNTKKIANIIMEEFEPIVQISRIFSLNISRALRLLKKSIDLDRFIQGQKEYHDFVYDVIRATIVFMHTSLETTLREIIRLKLKLNGDLSSIPLIGSTPVPNRKEKFSLSELAQHRGRNVNEIIEESIDEYLAGISFNSTNDIADHLKRNNIPQATLQKHYSILGEMIERRHKIVHEGDLKRGLFPTELEAIDTGKVVEWFNGTSDFCSELIRVAGIAIYLDKIMDRLKLEGIKANREDVINSIKVKVENKYPSDQIN